MRHPRISQEASVTAVAAAAVAALAAGGVLDLTGRPGAAHAVWVTAVAALLVPLTWSVARSLRRGDVGVDSIALLAMAGAIVLGEYLAGAVIAVMLSGGNALEAYAARRARRELTLLVSRAPRVAGVRRDDTVVQVAVEEVAAGDILVVRTGEVLPADGWLVSAEASVDEAALTGESRPVTALQGDLMRSGSTNVGAPFELRASHPASESAYAALVRLVERSQAARAPFVRLADSYAPRFLAVTLVLAAVAWAVSGDPVRALAVLVVATPCPLILAAPVALVSGVSAAARSGVIVKGAPAIEALGRVRTVLVDKTGTVTLGRPEVEHIIPADGYEPDEILRLAASVDQLSAHSLAASLVSEARRRGLALEMPGDIVEGVGQGIEGTVGGVPVLVGSFEFARRSGTRGITAARDEPAETGRVRIAVAVEGSLAGTVVMADHLREGAEDAIAQLRRCGIRHVAIVSGDAEAVTQRIGRELGVDAIYFEQSPEDKLNVCATIQRDPRLCAVAMVGDGINDAPVLAASDVGIALGTGGGTAAAETADVVIVDDRLDRVVDALRIGRRSMAIARQSVLVGIGLSLVGMVAAATGHLTPVEGALAQEAIDVAVILNALRALRAPEGEAAPAPVG